MANSEPKITVALPCDLWAQVGDLAATHPWHPSARKMLAEVVRWGLKAMAKLQELQEETEERFLQPLVREAHEEELLQEGKKQGGQQQEASSTGKKSVFGGFTRDR